MQTVNAGIPWLTILILLPLLGSLVLAVAKPLRQYARLVALVISLVVFALFCVVLLTEFRTDPAQLVELYSWIPQIGVSLAWGINGVGAVMIGLATLLVPVVILAEWNRFGAEQQGYFAWVLALEAIMIGLFAARDLFVFYVLFELMILPVYFMIGRYGGKDRKRAAMKFLIYSLAGGLIMLIGVISVYVAGPGGAGGFLIENLTGTLAMSMPAQLWTFCAFFIGFAIKAPMWPLHTWLPDATENASAGTSTLLVGVLDKLGTYGMIAICLPLFGRVANTAATVIIVLALISILWGGFMAIASKDLMRLVAYTSVSHFGFMVLAIFSGSKLAMAGAMLYMVAHGVGTAALFLVVGFLGQRGGSHLIEDYGGWQRVTPVLAGTFLVAGLATMALPGLSGFVPEYLVLMGTFQANKVAALVAVLGVILAAIYILLPYQRVFTGPRPEVAVPDLDAREKTVMGILIAAMLALGFFPMPVLAVLNPAADQTAQYLEVGSTTENPAAQGDEEGGNK
ncbi:MAG: NADH-quinone oxidoreductase subunit M [Trueperella sp.]|nr:NADH-quinone oxidoreductase subunit M [Trueperella sp.]